MKHLRTKLYLFLILHIISINVYCAGLFDVLKQLSNNLPSLPSTLSLPKSPDGVSTSIEDAYEYEDMMDGFKPDISEKREPEIDKNGIIIRPGFYDFSVQSYCLRAGTYRPKAQGNGYLIAPLQGERAEIIKNILMRSANYPEIQQHDIQVLIWAILSGAKINKMDSSKILIAKKLLSDEELFKVNGGFLGLIPDNLLQSAINKANKEIPQSYKNVLQAYNDMRTKLESGSSNFHELERLAVLDGDAIGENSKKIKPEQWMLRDGGYFIRVIPSGYQKTNLQIYKPTKSFIKKDNLGRVIEVDFNDGYIIKTNYESEPRNFVDPETNQTFKYSVVKDITFQKNQDIKKIKPASPIFVFSANDFLAQEKLSIFKNFHFISQAYAQSNSNTPIIERGKEVYSQYKNAKKIADSVKKVRAEQERQNRELSEKDWEEFADKKFYEDGIKQASKITDFSAKLEWTTEFLTRFTRASAYIICQMRGKCNSSSKTPPNERTDGLSTYTPQSERTDGLSTYFSPSGEVVVPGTSGVQRLGLSSRLAK